MKPRWWLAVCLLVFINAGTCAEVDWRSIVKDCDSSANDAEFAACIRAGIARQEQLENDAADEANKARRPTGLRFVVRDTASSIATLHGVEAGEKGGTLSIQRKNGEDATLAKVAVAGVLPAQLGGRLQPFVGGAWQRDGTSTDRRDIRDVTFGAVGPWWETAGSGHSKFTLLGTLQATHRNDRYGTTGGDLVRAHFDLSWARLASGELLGGVSLLPHVAALWHRRSDAGAADGMWQSTYAGFSLTKPVDTGAGRVKLALVARRLFDHSIPDNNVRRRVSYANISADFFLFDPANKSAPLQPSIYIARETGQDFLNGGAKMNQTTVGLRVKYR